MQPSPEPQLTAECISGFPPWRAPGRPRSVRARIGTPDRQEHTIDHDDTDRDGDRHVLWEHATVLSGVGTTPIPDGGVLVRGDRVLAVGSRRDLASSAPSGTAHADLDGAFLLPGLVDSHQHIATPPDVPYATAQLEREVYGGVTAIRVMADDLRVIAELARAADAGELPAPSIDFAAFVAGPSFFDDERMRVASAGYDPGTAPWMQAVDADTDLVQAVAVARGTGARAIKVYTDLGPDLVRRITDEAHRQGLLVWAHGTVFPSGPAEVVRAGVDAVSHACLLGYEGDVVPSTYAQPRADIDPERFRDRLPDAVEALLQEMHRRDCVLDATLLVDAPTGVPGARMPASARITARAAEIGVVVSAGTDFPTTADDPFPAMHRELDLLVEHAGFTPEQALAAATVGGAAALGRSDVGRIVPGARADMIATTEDPTLDLAALRSITTTIARGRRLDRRRFDPRVRSRERTPQP
ncbi:amidohydrolase family protein [Curtobacterium sp. L1-20]|uniref:amidohydrolase family protein n=1 Tax=Curtobacterium sp. L1-20 TaxID=3138181 RepID=UPI003B5281BE